MFCFCQESKESNDRASTSGSVAITIDDEPDAEGAKAATSTAKQVATNNQAANNDNVNEDEPGNGSRHKQNQVSTIEMIGQMAQLKDYSLAMMQQAKVAYQKVQQASTPEEKNHFLMMYSHCQDLAQRAHVDAMHLDHLIKQQTGSSKAPRKVQQEPEVSPCSISADCC